MAHDLPAPATGADEATRVIEQRRFGQRTRFDLRRDDFEYTLVAGGSTRSWRMDYAGLSRDRESLVDRNTWWRNVGLLWVLIGAVVVVAGYLEQQTLRGSIWLWLGLGCLAVYQVRVIRYRIVPAERCNVLVIDDARADAILGELERRRARQLRERFDYLSPHEHPEQQRRRIEWLRQQGALDGNEASARLLQLDTMNAVRSLDRPAGHDDE
jgi:hypothetical protein